MGAFARVCGHLPREGHGGKRGRRGKFAPSARTLEATRKRLRWVEQLARRLQGKPATINTSKLSSAVAVKKRISGEGGSSDEGDVDATHTEPYR